MINESEIRKIIKSDFAKMQESDLAKEIEIIKGLIKKEVGVLRRRTFLAFLFASLHSKELFGRSPDLKLGDKRDGHNKETTGDKTVNSVSNKNNSSNKQKDLCSFWCNLKGMSRQDGEKFLRFVEKECGIPSNSACNYVNCGKFSFFDVNERYADKVKTTFVNKKEYNGHKLAVRVKK